jgi:hypothetical protein
MNSMEHDYNTTKDSYAVYKIGYLKDLANLL